jgi:hypothetical protein
MKRFHIILAVVASGLLAGCAPLLSALMTGMPAAPVAGQTASAPVTSVCLSTNQDEQKLQLAFDGFDTLLFAVDALRDGGVIKPGTPRALQLQKGLIVIRDSLNTAAAAQRACNATSYGEAIAHARATYDQVKTLLQEIRR